MTGKRRAAVLGLAWGLGVVVVLGGRPVEAASRRGDVDANGALELTDAISILNFLFLGGKKPPCTPVADVNADGGADLTDAVALLTYLFLGGKVPAALSAEDLAVCKGLDYQAVVRGMAVYTKSDLDKNPQSTPFACGTCHEMVPDAESPMVLSGHSMDDALRRPTYKNGKLTRFIDAANVCRKDWMHTTLYQETDADYTDLVAFLESLSPDDPRPAVSYQIVCQPVPGPAGDASAGCKLFNRSCASCHGVGGKGTPLAPSLLGISPDLDNPEYLRLRIRVSGPSVIDNPDVVYPCLIGFTVMPFWTKDKLSDQQVEDIIASLLKARTDPAFGCLDTPPPPTGKVVRSGTLTRRQHAVSGTVEELDSRKIRLKDLSYDSGGILVKTWLYKSGAILRGQAIGPDLRRAMPYRSETVVVDIPEGIASDQFDSVAVWCQAVGVSFGDAKLGVVPP